MIKIRLIFDIIVILISILLGLYLLFNWFSHGMPVWDNAGMMPGNKKSLFPWLTYSVISLSIGAAALIDLYIYTNKNNDE